jgi:hypothetical protein
MALALRLFSTDLFGNHASPVFSQSATSIFDLQLIQPLGPTQGIFGLSGDAILEIPHPA